MAFDKERLQYLGGVPGQLIRLNPEQKTAFKERRDVLVPLIVVWTGDVPDDVIPEIQGGVKDVLLASGQKRKTVLLGNTTINIEKPFSNPDQYIETCLNIQKFKRDRGYGMQIDVGWLFGLFLQDPIQSKLPHWKVFITNHDLTGQNEYGQYVEYGFGNTSQQFGFSIISLARFTRNAGTHDRKAGVRRSIMHEIGHLFQLPNRTFHIEENLGTHCINVCVMRQGNSVKKWIQLGIEERKNGVIFCGDCQKDLGRLQANYHARTLSPHK